VLDRSNPFENLELQLGVMDFDFYSSNNASVRTRGYGYKDELAKSIRECAAIDADKTRALCERLIPNSHRREYPVPMRVVKQSVGFSM
jgi:hypothetical protein